MQSDNETRVRNLKIFHQGNENGVVLIHNPKVKVKSQNYFIDYFIEIGKPHMYFLTNALLMSLIKVINLSSSICNLLHMNSAK